MSATFNPSGGYRVGGLAALLLHAGALGGAVLFATQVTLPPVAPIMVSLIAAPVPEARPQEPPRPLPMRSQPSRSQPPRTPLAQPQLVAADPAAAPSEAAPAPQAPTPPAAAPVSQAPAPVTPPRFDVDYLDNPPPAYPPLSRRMGEQGLVLLRVLVNDDGTAARVELKSSSGSSRLDQAALHAVRRWRFVPAKQGTQALAAWVQVPISFTLKG